MRLLKRSSHGGFDLVSFDSDKTPPYAILSHTWTEGQEITYDELLAGLGKDKTGYEKIRFCGDQAAADGLEFFWVDTCCIKKSDIVELSTAINSMFRWYQRAFKCYVYLADVSVSDDITDAGSFPIAWQTAFRQSRWFTRGWTLQELVAPSSVEFFCKEGKRLGSRVSLEREIHEVTKVPIAALRGQSLVEFSIEDRMSWTAGRTTTVEEDMVYCLLGIFGVFIPLIYGERKAYAMLRLKDEMKRRQEGHGRKSLRDLDVSSSLPFPKNEHFVGRKDELKSLEDYLFVPNEHRRMTIYGLGGCGKSALAIKFAYQVTTRRARMVFWVPAISQESFETAYREIGARLRIPGIADDNSDVKKLVQTTLGSDDMADWLMIVDNADDHDVLLGVMDSTSKPVRLRDYLPRSSRGAILFTTRSRKIAEALTPSNALEVTDMDQADVEQLLKRRISKKTLLDDETAVDELLVLLTNLPLAIVQAAAFMNNNEVSVRDYISLLRNAEDETELFGNQFEDPNRYEGLDSTIAKTWQISFEQIRKHDELAADYLSFMACIDRINIPQSLLPPATSPVQQMKALGTLKGYAFITEQVSVAEKQGGGKFYDMHRLVHMASAHWLQRHNQRTTWVDAAIDRLKDVVPIYAYDELQTRTEWTVHLPHALHVANLNGVVGTLPSAEVLYRVGECQHSLGQYSTAELTFRQVLLVQEKEFGLEHPDTLQTLYVLAYVLDRQGVHAEAENMIRKTIELREKVLGDENVASLSSISTLAVILGHQGMHAKAEAIHRKTLELQRKILGEEDRHTLWSMNNLARTLHSQGKHAEAERMYRETLELRKKLLGEEHPHTLSGMSNLAGTLDDQRKYAEAERMYRETLELRKKVLGEEHPDTLRDMSNLARTLHGQKKYAEAEILYREALELQEKMLGEKHPSTLRIMGYLGRTIAKQGRYDESFTLFERACAGLVKVLGEEHPDVRWYQKDYRYHLARRERERLAADTGKLDLTFPDPNKPDIISSDNEEPDLIDHDIGKPDLIDHNTGKSDLIYRDTGEPDLKAPDAGMLASSSVVGNSKRSRMKRGLARMGIRTSKSHKD